MNQGVQRPVVPGRGGRGGVLGEEEGVVLPGGQILAPGQILGPLASQGHQGWW